MHFIVKSVRPEYLNDNWLFMHALNECFNACFHLNDCSTCKFYDIFECECRSNIYCKSHLKYLALERYMRSVENWCVSHPERTMYYLNGTENPCNGCEYLSLGACALELNTDCPYGRESLE